MEEIKQIKATVFTVDHEIMEDLDSLISLVKEKEKEFRSENNVPDFVKIGISFAEEVDFYLNHKTTVRLHYYYTI